MVHFKHFFCSVSPLGGSDNPTILSHTKKQQNLCSFMNLSSWTSASQPFKLCQKPTRSPNSEWLVLEFLRTFTLTLSTRNSCSYFSNSQKKDSLICKDPNNTLLLLFFPGENYLKVEKKVQKFKTKETDCSRKKSSLCIMNIRLYVEENNIIPA